CVRTDTNESRAHSTTSRVEDWRGCSVGAAYLLTPRFLWECLTSRTVSPFPAPATSHPACGFPALGAPVCFVSSFMRPIEMERLSDLALVPYLVVVKQLQVPI